MKNNKFYHAGKIRQFTIQNAKTGFIYQVGNDWLPMSHSEACTVIQKQSVPKDWLVVELATYTKESMITHYLSYVNDFISLPAFAEFYGYSEVVAQSVINRGRVLHDVSLGNRSHFISNTVTVWGHNGQNKSQYAIKRGNDRLLSEHSA